jgi:hypothetical protein
MRLLNTVTLKLEYFMATIPKYAILSHTWEEEEVTFDDMKPGEAPQTMKGYTKLHRAATLASTQGYEYIWIDTCCIDKSSSAELSEAINSMFTWYRNAAICNAYLSDYSAGPDDLESCSQENLEHLRQAKWWTRGWTLQELIAPNQVSFFDTDWFEFGTREKHSAVFTGITGIHEDILTGKTAVSDVSAAVRMTWAAKRVTTRPEDMAYCLLGLFDVNMPLLYGEGAEKAFVRLQQQFLKEVEDDSIFAWWAPKEESLKRACWGLFAPTPKYFADSVGIESGGSPHWGSQPVEATNRGVRVEMSISPMEGDRSRSLYFTYLRCTAGKRLAIVLVLQRLSPLGNIFTRAVPHVRPVLTQAGLVHIPTAEFSEDFMTLFGDTMTMELDTSNQIPVVSFLVKQQSFSEELIFVRATRVPSEDPKFHDWGLTQSDDVPGKVICQDVVGTGHAYGRVLDEIYPGHPSSGIRYVVVSGEIVLLFHPAKPKKKHLGWRESVDFVLGYHLHVGTPFGTVAPWLPPFCTFLPPGKTKDDESMQDRLRGSDTRKLPNGLVLSMVLQSRFHEKSASYRLLLHVSMGSSSQSGQKDPEHTGRLWIGLGPQPFDADLRVAYPTVSGSID